MYFPIISNDSAQKINEALKDVDFYRKVILHVYQKQHFRFFGRASLFPFFTEEYLLRAPYLRNSLVIHLFSELVPSIGRSTFFLNFADNRGKYFCEDSQEFFNNPAEVEKHLQDENHYLKAEEIYEIQDNINYAKKWALNKEL